MTRAINDDEPLDHEAEAAAWCWRIADGALSAAERDTFEAWLRADPAHQPTFDAMVAVWQGTDAIAEMPGFLSLRAKALTTMEAARDGARPTGRPRGHWGLRWSAAAALVATIGAGLLFLANRPDGYRTGIGERRVVRLADGSRISLDASSIVTVAYSSNRRTLALEQGRARFDVAKDPLRPFAVSAGQKTVIATGTAFSVELLRRQVHVLLYEGHVAVLSKARGDSAPAPVRLDRRNIAADQLLKPGDELVTADSSPVASVAPADVDQSLSWEAGRLSFAGEPLPSAVERINRYATTKVVIGDAQTAHLRVDGVFNAGDTRGFVSGLASLYPISVRTDGDRIILVSRLPAEPLKKSGANVTDARQSR